MKNMLSFIVAFSLLSCNRGQNGDVLGEADIKRMKTLNILDEGEGVLKFYSEYKKENVGNFFTDKRIAKYWIDPRDNAKDQVFSVFYSDVKSLDTVYNAGATYCPYVLVTKIDGSSFKVCAGSKRQDVVSFFEAIMAQWKAHVK